MKLSSKKENEDKIIERIKGFFDTQFIEEISRLTKFVQRKSKLQGIVFFSMCVYRQERGNY
jgi:hypothetical protein